ncbi:hypothetical protein NST21_19960 [Peribacillus sp. FSL K6-1552]|uniref:hypothetical protein n=1 Tax=Peribacillus TaxID=2675229 RepID=UPI001FD0F46A|nr:hypothetical protein [Peribacillus butanolivorans]
MVSYRKKLRDNSNSPTAINLSYTSEISDIWKNNPYYLIYCEDPIGNIIELYSRSTEMMYENKE